MKNPRTGRGVEQRKELTSEESRGEGFC